MWFRAVVRSAARLSAARHRGLASSASSVAQPSADALLAAAPPSFRPKVGIVLGSGLGGIADELSNRTDVPFSSLPGFPQSSVEGHAGKMVLGTLEGVDVVCMQGRIHMYAPSAISTFNS